MRLHGIRRQRNQTNLPSLRGKHEAFMNSNYPRSVSWTLALLVLTVASAATGPVATYSLNEVSGTTAADSSGNGNSGTVSDATWTTQGRYGGALSFNGSSGSVTVLNSIPALLV